MLAAISLIAVLAVDDVEKHVVEEQPPRHDRFEVGLMQASQVNVVSTQHFGLAATGVWHIQQNVGLMLMGLWNFYSSQSPFGTDLINRVRAEVTPNNSLLLHGGVLAGVEVAPLQGKLAIYDSRLAHFSIVLNGAVGVGWMRAALKPYSDCSNQSMCFPDATFGDAGMRLLAEVGGGFRVLLGDFIAIRLELRDLIYGASISAINGCNKADLDPFLGPAKLSSGCDVAAFSGTGSDGRPRVFDVPLAFSVLSEKPSTAIINNLGLYVGATATF